MDFYERDNDCNRTLLNLRQSAFIKWHTLPFIMYSKMSRVRAKKLYVYKLNHECWH